MVPSTVLAVIDRAIQLHGAAGVSQDFPLAYFWVAARTLRIADGPDEVRDLGWCSQTHIYLLMHVCVPSGALDELWSRHCQGNGRTAVQALIGRPLPLPLSLHCLIAQTHNTSKQTIGGGT